MDRQTTLGFLLVFMILLAWMWYNAQSPKQPAEKPSQGQTKDTVKTQISEKTEPKPEKPSNPYGTFFSTRSSGRERLIRVETDLYIAELSTKGATVRRWELKKYK